MWIELQSGGVVIESMDALFGLCRKKSAGKSVRKPLSGTLMFADQNAVDEFVLDYASRKAKQGTNSVSFVHNFCRSWFVLVVSLHCGD